MKIQDRYCQGLIASALSQRRTVEAAGAMARAATSRASSGHDQRDSEVLPGLIRGLVAVGHLLQLVALGGGQHDRHGAGDEHGKGWPIYGRDQLCAEVRRVARAVRWRRSVALVARRAASR